jgi:gliding motility-associated lipoprotein GldD
VHIKHRATIHLTYKNINTDVFELLEESRAMVYKHTVKADEIAEKKYTNDVNKTYGTLYDIYGETASSVQFHITDSNSNFLRGALYFRVNPNQDSLRPIINYLRKDIINIMETLQWGNPSVSKE